MPGLQPRISACTARSAAQWRIGNGIFHWNLTVQPNSTATIYVPTSEAVSVTEGGQSAAHVAGVRFLRNERNAVVYEIASGTYDFAARFFPVARAPAPDAIDVRKTVVGKGSLFHDCRVN